MRGTTMMAVGVVLSAAIAGCDPQSVDNGSVAPAGQALLSISVQGAGLVRGDGISDCRQSCTKAFPTGTAIRLVAVPDPGQTFGGWSGACSETAACDLKIDSNISLTARFDPLPPPSPGKVRLTVTLDGHGSVRSAPSGIACGATCTAPFDSGSSVALAASADSGWTFVGWSEACSGAGGCALTLTADTRVTARFEAAPKPPEITTLVASDGTNAGVFGLNATQVFFSRATATTVSLWQVPKTGGLATQLYSKPYIGGTGCCIVDIVADDQFVYWTDSNSIRRVPVAGGATQDLYTGFGTRTIVLDSDKLYWTTFGPNNQTGSGSVWVGPAAGGTAAALATGLPSGGLAVDSKYAYWTGRDRAGTGFVARVPKAGGPTDFPIACGACNPGIVRTDAQNIYYRNADSDIWARSKAGGDPILLSSGNPRNASAFNLDLDVNASVAYWMFDDGDPSHAHGLFRARVDGSGWTPIETSSDTTWMGPRVDDTEIFYFHGGALLRRSK